MPGNLAGLLAYRQKFRGGGFSRSGSGISSSLIRLPDQPGGGKTMPPAAAVVSFPGGGCKCRTLAHQLVKIPPKGIRAAFTSQMRHPEELLDRHKSFLAFFIGGGAANTATLNKLSNHRRQSAGSYGIIYGRRL